MLSGLQVFKVSITIYLLEKINFDIVTINTNPHGIICQGLISHPCLETKCVIAYIHTAMLLLFLFSLFPKKLRKKRREKGINLALWGKPQIFLKGKEDKASKQALTLTCFTN